MTSDQLVSVVVPAYNGAATIDETLRSVRSQSHQALEIIVVDDGSRDNTAELVQAHVAADSRIRIIQMPNGGVAAARNRGWREAAGEFIAFVDADDLWAPTKIERQLAALHAAGPECGLVYCWYAKIDKHSTVTDWRSRPSFAGDVLDQLFRGNFVGNGSAALVRRQALIDAGGFDSGLRDAGAQGCEDLMFYMRVAERHHFAVVCEYLVGYRYLPDNMSSDMRRMLRSWLLVVNEMVSRHPDKAQLMRQGLKAYGSWLACQAIYLKDHRQLWRVLGFVLKTDPRIGSAIAFWEVPKALFDLARRAPRHLRWRLRRWRRRDTATVATPAQVFCIGNPAS